jgi:hypothetical protein
MIRTMLRFTLVILTLVATSGSHPLQAQEPTKPSPGGKHRIVCEVTMDGQQQWTAALNNAANAQEAFGKGNLEIELVARSNAVALLLKSDEALRDRIQQLA